jgi:hypothetical protein
MPNASVEIRWRNILLIQFDRIEYERAGWSYRSNAMSKLVGLTAVDWSYRCMYMEELDRSGRKRLESWELELKNWDPDDESTMPSGYALSRLPRPHHR